MGRSFDSQEIELLRNLGLEHKNLSQWVFDVLDERHSFPDWARTAHEADWGPPRDWYKDEREQISKLARELIDQHVIGLDARWRCYRVDPNPMQIIAEQAS